MFVIGCPLQVKNNFIVISIVRYRVWSDIFRWRITRYLQTVSVNSEFYENSYYYYEADRNSIARLILFTREKSKFLLLDCSACFKAFCAWLRNTWRLNAVKFHVMVIRCCEAFRIRAFFSFARFPQSVLDSNIKRPWIAKIVRTELLRTLLNCLLPKRTISWRVSIAIIARSYCRPAENS